MKNCLKAASLILCAFALSGCAFTNNVLQGAYDLEAEKQCSASSQNKGSIDNAKNPRCVNGEFYSKPRTKPKSGTEKK